MADIHHLPTGSQQPSIDALNLANLPDRLDDTTLAMVETIAHSPLPRLPACNESHLAKCLRLMLAVLPRQQTDEVGGELFVEAYRRHLAEFPNEAISFLASEATGRCKWFPTIVECKEILHGWHRSDAASRRREHARQIARREHNLRYTESLPPRDPAPPLTQAAVDAMSAPLKRIGLSSGLLVQDDEGNIRPAPEAA